MAVSASQTEALMYKHGWQAVPVKLKARYLCWRVYCMGEVYIPYALV